MIDPKEIWKISVIVPVYNVEEYLDQCISSIVGQEYTNLEIILVDDGSSDGSPAICDAWARRDERVRVVHQPNGGLSAARNNGMELATGEYISFVDSDDFIEPAMYRKLMDAIREYQAEVTICGRFSYDEHGDCEAQLCVDQPEIYDGDRLLREFLLGFRFDESAWGKLYKRELFYAIAFPVGEINEDIVTLDRVFARCQRAVHIGQPLYHYRFNPHGITVEKYNEKYNYRILIAHIQEVLNFVESGYPDMKMELDIFQYRYVCGLLRRMLTEKRFQEQNTKKDYYSDYVYCRRVLWRTGPSYMKHPAVRAKDKLFAVLVLCRLYVPMRTAKRAVFRWLGLE